MKRVYGLLIVGLGIFVSSSLSAATTTIPQATEIVVDGKTADWEAIKAVPVSKGKPCVKLAWAYDQGVYGLVHVDDATVKGSDEKPFTADSIEIFIESDNHKAAEADDSSCAAQIVIGIPSSGKEGAASVGVFYGQLGYNTDIIKAVWSKTPTGYVIEFQLPVKVFAPVEIEFGRKIGFDFAINDDGKKTVVFSNCVEHKGYRKPRQWGTIELGK